MRLSIPVVSSALPINTRATGHIYVLVEPFPCHTQYLQSGVCLWSMLVKAVQGVERNLATVVLR